MCLLDIRFGWADEKCVQPVKKVSLKRNVDDFLFCIDFADRAKFSPRIHILPTGVKVILSFREPITAPKTKRMNHPIINGYFFERIGASSMMMILSLKEKAVFTEKRYTQNSIKIGFKIPPKRSIILDAGHGGKDPGTNGISGDFEKNITLVMAIELRNALLNSGRYKVTLTRDRDSFISIEDRKKTIASANADLLISLHTDSNNDRNLRGISVYTLPNWNLLKQVGEKCNYQIDEANYSRTLSLSRKFSNILVGYIPNACKIKTHPCRDVELKILKAHMPAVLVELGCISNKKDNQLLHSKAFREKANRAILYALDKFFEMEKSGK
jgi:N-acetylmuramoyl-L-alanine amidase